MSALVESLRALGAGRLAAMAAVAVVLCAALAVLAGRGGGGSRLALLYADLDAREAAQITEQLDAQHITREVSAAGDRVMVPEADVGRARLLLARQGLPSGGSIGYEIFDRGDALTTSSFQQQINQTRALEGELARTIRAIAGVRGARVHLVLPRREPFAREQQEAQASVMLAMAGASRLDHEGVQAVLNLVAAAVSGLRAKNVSVIDSRGDVLARAGEPAEGTPTLAARRPTPVGRPSCACRARWRTCWSAPWASARSGRKPRSTSTSPTSRRRRKSSIPRDRCRAAPRT